MNVSTSPAESLNTSLDISLDTSEARLQGEVVRRRGRNGRKARTAAFHLTASFLSLLWIGPLLLVVVLSVRSFDDILSNGLMAIPRSFSFRGYTEAWGRGGGKQGMLNSFIITIPALTIVLIFSSLAAFGLSRFRVPFRRTILLVMLAGNLLPAQIMLIPLARNAEALGLFDSFFAVIILHAAFGLGFYVFVLYGFMLGIPAEIQQAAIIDGATPFQIYRMIILPLSKPALASIGALGFTGIFNDLLWSITVLRSENKMPVTASLLGLQGTYLSDWGLISAGTITAAIPTLIVFLLFQKSFVGGLTLGAVK
jgi:multiple sugar transport system permease protein